MVKCFVFPAIVILAQTVYRKPPGDPCLRRGDHALSFLRRQESPIENARVDNHKPTIEHKNIIPLKHVNTSTHEHQNLPHQQHFAGERLFVAAEAIEIDTAGNRISGIVAGIPNGCVFTHGIIAIG